MYQMEKITTGVSYTTSAVGTGYWLLQLLDKVSPSQWVAPVILEAQDVLITYRGKLPGIITGSLKTPPLA
ncbi:phage holin [Escherichia coli]|uniref:phage holin n=1 Tax=Escherichia coli TaxID=562 RepID=UPI00085A4DC8|nr:phage holin [Escherichia coli]